jgi:hypothetical protein
MVYEKQNFEDGRVLSASQLNYMEEGIVAALSERTIPITAPKFDDLVATYKLAVGNFYLITESDELGIAYGYHKGDIFLATGVHSYERLMNIDAEQALMDAKKYVDSQISARIIEARVG